MQATKYTECVRCVRAGLRQYCYMPYLRCPCPTSETIYTHSTVHCSFSDGADIHLVRLSILLYEINDWTAPASSSSWYGVGLFLSRITIDDTKNEARFLLEAEMVFHPMSIDLCQIKCGHTFSFCIPHVTFTSVPELMRYPPAIRFGRCLLEKPSWAQITSTNHII